MNRVLTTYPGFSPQKPWDGRHWAHVAIYIRVANINPLNTLSVIFVLFFLYIFWYFFLYKIGNWTLCSVNHERTSIRAFFNMQARGGGANVLLMPPLHKITFCPFLMHPRKSPFFLNLYKQTSEK